MLSNKEFSDKYYSYLENIQTTYMNDGSSLSGYFENESLEIGTEGISLQFIEKIDEFFTTYSNDDLHEKIHISLLMRKHNEAKDTIKMIQTFSHETFHLMQALTLRATNEFVFNLRELKDIEFMVFAYTITSGNHWKYGRHRHVLDILDDLDDIQFSEWIQEKLRKASYKNLEIIKNYTHRTNGISVLDLVEGSAVAFQELGSRSVDKEVFSFKKDTVYTKAFEFFIQNINTNLPKQESRFLFLMTSYFSLKYGFCSYFNESEPDNPVNIFTYFAENIDRIVSQKTTHSTSKIEMMDDFNCLTDLSKIYVDSFEKNNNSDTIFLVNHLIETTNNILTLVSEYYKKIGAEHFMEFSLSYDRKMKPLNNYLKENIPLYESHYFISFLINDLKYFELKSP